MVLPRQPNAGVVLAEPHESVTGKWQVHPGSSGTAELAEGLLSSFRACVFKLRGGWTGEINGAGLGRDVDKKVWKHRKS